MSISGTILSVSHINLWHFWEVLVVSTDTIVTEHCKDISFASQCPRVAIIHMKRSPFRPWLSRRRQLASVLWYQGNMWWHVGAASLCSKGTGAFEVQHLWNQEQGWRRALIQCPPQNIWFWALCMKTQQLRTWQEIRAQVWSSPRLVSFKRRKEKKKKILWFSQMKRGTSFLYPANQLSPKVETDTSLEIIWQSLWSIMKSFSVAAAEGLKKKTNNQKT